MAFPTPPPDELHECEGECGRTIPIRFHFCLYCRSKLRREKICQWCGKKPIHHPQSPYCLECKQIAAKKAAEKEIRPKFIPGYRGAGARENTHQTKFGSGH